MIFRAFVFNLLLASTIMTPLFWISYEITLLSVFSFLYSVAVIFATTFNEKYTSFVITPEETFKLDKND